MKQIQKGPLIDTDQDIPWGFLSKIPYERQVVRDGKLGKPKMIKIFYHESPHRSIAGNLYHAPFTLAKYQKILSCIRARPYIVLMWGLRTPNTKANYLHH